MPRRRRIRRGEVYLVSYVFPHERRAATGGSNTEKDRPVLILQNDEDNDNERYPLVLAAPITTQKIDRIYEQDVLLPAGDAKLKQESKVLLGLTQPFVKARLGRKVGRLAPHKMTQVELKLLRLLGFARRNKLTGSE